MTTRLSTRPGPIDVDRGTDYDPPPRYTRIDPDSISIHSAAPSYVSDTPTYTSTTCQSSTTPQPQPQAPTSLLPIPTPGPQRTRLPNPRYAPGFENRTHASTPDHPPFAIARSNNARQYAAIIHRRRASKARATTEALLKCLTADAPPPAPPTTHSLAEGGHYASNVSAYPVSILPSSPLEDPILVGEEAATRARRARVHCEMCERVEEARVWESRSWDFMLGQMEGWGDGGRWRRGKGMGWGKRLVGRM